uniref:Proline-, glutamic acid- and leucine-rich protein 1 n=2 Tax=Elaeis guineensis var. tenera TaxID=51953 RepID=A0A8N4F0A7_ELAGV|nr:proline-, glutamic acid- and leucine-rich protein 1 [Elaeis guineensis]
MPSGAKKRKAAKRKKEQEEKEKAMGSNPDPPDDPLPSPPALPQPQGNDHKDQTTQEETESGELETPFATPLSQVNEEEGEGIPGSERIAVDLATESLENDKREADEVKVRVMAAAAAAEEAFPSPKDELGVEIVRSEKGEPWDAEGAKEPVNPVEQSVVASEEVEREKESLAESPKEALPAVDPPPSHESEVKIVPHPEKDAVEKQPRVSAEARQGSGRAETVATTEVVSRGPQVVHRARWWNCCGLLDVLVHSER